MAGAVAMVGEEHVAELREAIAAGEEVALFGLWDGQPRSGTQVGLAKTLSNELGREGILVNAVAPGKIVTGSPAQQNERILAYARERTPFTRLGLPDDVATAALFLAAEASYISGSNLLVDGGFMAY